MTEKILQTVIAAFIKELFSESKVLFSDMLDEAKQFIGVELKKYLEKQKTKYAHIKTLLRGNTPVYLYDIYYPLYLLDDKHSIVKTDQINTIFEKTNYITIIGDAGSGKSTLSKHLFLNSIKEKYGIPVLIELRYLNETDGDIERYIIEKIFENKLAQNGKIIERLLKHGKFVFFLDGFDELNSEIRNKVVKSFNSFINQFDTNKFILTSRPYSNIENLPLFKNYTIKTLDQTTGEINGFIDLQLKKEKELADKIKASLKENKSLYIRSFLANPLLLTLYILTFQTNAEIPSKKYIFYRRVINALFSEHDSKTKLGYVREKQSNLTQEQFEEILKAFCIISYFEQRYDFDFDYISKLLSIIKSKNKKLEFSNVKFLSDLKSAIALWTEDNGVYAFAHRSLQEYFAALFIKHLNPKENERAYKKIIEKFSDEKTGWVVENFLSLLHEMDEMNFYNYYYLPILKELYSLFNDESESGIVNNFVTFFTDGFIFRHKNDLEMNVNLIVYKSMYIHLSFTRPLYNYLTKIFNCEQIRTHAELKECKVKNFQSFKFHKNIPQDLFKKIMESPIRQISLDFHKYLKDQISKVEKTIERSMTLDREIIDLI